MNLAINIREFFNYLKYSFENRGFYKSLNLWLKESKESFRNNDLSIISKQSFSKKSEFVKRFNPYQATYYVVLKDAFDFILDNEEINSIIDIGMGKGRVLKYAKRAGIKYITGIEISDEFIQKPTLDSTNQIIEIINCNALDYYPNRKFDLLFIFNPFSKSDFDTLLSNFSEVNSLPNLILSINPKYSDVISEFNYRLIKSLYIGKHCEYALYKKTGHNTVYKK